MSKHSVKTLDFCVNQAVAKIFNTCDKDCITEIRLFCDLPDVSVLIERRRMNFMNNIYTALFTRMYTGREHEYARQ